MIAMALACKPKVLIADEPTTALDTTVQAQVMALLKRAQRDHGTAMLLITHNIAVAAEAAETVAVMYAGRIVEAGPVSAVFRAPRHPYTRGLLGAIPKFDGESDTIPKLVEIGGNVPRPGTLMSGCAFEPRCPRARARCRTETPRLAPAGGSRTVACFFPIEAALQ
jgi:oligopeptide/dipeptide ABC transporter ATP-binding protein